MVLLTAVPVSGPCSMTTGVMVATRALPAVAGAAATGAAPAVGAVRSAAMGAPADSAVGAAASEADMSSLSPPNMLSMVEQAPRLNPADSANARTRPDLSLVFAGNPLILLSAADAVAPEQELRR